jgi:hypothetical protein
VSRHAYDVKSTGVRRRNTLVTLPRTISARDVTADTLKHSKVSDFDPSRAASQQTAGTHLMTNDTGYDILGRKCTGCKQELTCLQALQALQTRYS